MSLARQEFLVRIETLSACLKEENLNDGPPTDHLRNQIATMMRQGLAVLAFAALEAFIRERSAECIKNFDPASVAFSDLSDALQDATTIGATRGLLFRYKFEDPATRLTWALGQLKAIASSDTSLSSLSGLSFGNDKANLEEDDIAQILKSFGVEKPWPGITDVAKRAGIGGLLDSKTQFIKVKLTRHSSAHDVDSGVPHGDLSSSVQTIRGLAVGFDMLLSHAVSMHNLGRIPGKASEPKVDASQIKLLFVSELVTTPGSYEVYRMLPATTTLPVSKVHIQAFTSKFEALFFAANEGNLSHEHVVDVGVGGLVLDWQTW